MVLNEFLGTTASEGEDNSSLPSIVFISSIPE